MNLRPSLLGLTVTAALAFGAREAAAATCQVDACTAQIQAASGLVVNDIFKDSNGNDGQHLPVYGKLINNWPGCPEHVDFAGAGHSNAPFDCDGEYTSTSANPTVADANTYLGALDRQWWQPCRLNNPALTDIGGGTMCTQDWTCIADGTGGNYNPWQGLVFDLGGPSNKVVIFAENDHGPQPCESLEYTVFLSDNPNAREQVLHPATDGVDPQKWNRAVLSKIYTAGWIQVRPPDPVGHGTACGDTADYSVEEDSFVQIFALPCGITFRYASIVAGNDGLDFSSCAYDSNEAELDAVAGLTESGAAVCPDADHDGYVDCNCAGAPAVCDCNDADPNVHPGAPEACDSLTDLNCDGQTGTPCATGLTCNASQCLAACGSGENPFCAAGTTCQTTTNGRLCVPDDCGCSPGQVCKNNVCVDACQGVQCPGTQACQDGACVDPCAHIMCPQGQSCIAGQCQSPCSCFAGDIGCSSGLTCDAAGSMTCVDPICKGVSCPTGETCDPTSGACVSFCNAGVTCPEGQTCVSPTGCVPLCSTVQCDVGLTCDPATGKCVDHTCDSVVCFSPQVCQKGVCVDQPSGAGGAGGGGGAGAGGAGEGGKSSTGSHSTTGSAGGSKDSGDTGGCGCTTAGGSEGKLGGVLGLSLLGLVAARRRRARSQ